MRQSQICCVGVYCLVFGVVERLMRNGDSLECEKGLSYSEEYSTTGVFPSGSFNGLESILLRLRHLIISFHFISQSLPLSFTHNPARTLAMRKPNRSRPIEHTAIFGCNFFLWVSLYPVNLVSPRAPANLSYPTQGQFRTRTISGAIPQLDAILARQFLGLLMRDDALSLS